MPELRWTLLIVGALFIVGLALWELRRQRQAPRQGVGPGASSGSDRVTPTLEGMGESGRVHREPTITLPELHPEPRTPSNDPPVVEVAAEAFAQLRAQEETTPPVIGAVEVPVVEVEESASVGFATGVEEHDVAAPQPLEEQEPSIAGRPEAEPREVHPEGASADGAPVVEWPREETRKIVALRLVSAPAARFQGRAVRQALAAEGFVLGKFDIFHKAGPDERAVLSAASLTKPGTFTLNTIDAQRFGGISLFAVLPGPLPAQETFDTLLSTARNLNDRLQGALQDERGEPLTPVRSATIRQSLGSGDDPIGQHGFGEDGGMSGSGPPSPHTQH